MGIALACGGQGFDAEDVGATADSEAAYSSAEATDVTPDESSADDSELGTAQQELFGLSLPSSCGDFTGTDSILAGLAVSTASELKRWQPMTDFQLSWGSLVLTATGKKQCADGKCFNTQALLDLQKDAASKAQIKPGVNVIPLLVRTALTLAYARQATCFSLLGIPLIGCGIPAHQFKLSSTEKGGCDTNYWFEAQTPAGAPLPSSALAALQKGLVWVNTESNKYIQFQVNGNKVGIDPTYGLNEVGSTSLGSCSAACTKVSSSDVTGQCCSCNGTKKFSRSAWNTTTYICQ
jgi:hypothetical protein